MALYYVRESFADRCRESIASMPSLPRGATQLVGIVRCLLLRTGKVGYAVSPRYDYWKAQSRVMHCRDGCALSDVRRLANPVEPSTATP